ncbi:MAG: hypothetical protein CVU56_24990 [Deltaproteobacteria bacterium HGW-Deltaproteobacteria-14]|jgi:ABC-type uncharacterized transport system auxiliary subunit|nr:MAG: hypothetical protein CVU56_24990 [Deltaproteobacteria bacterium HGW-Deltaproteobacteria-14]
MVRVWLVILGFALLAPALGGCFGGSTQARSYFALEYPRGQEVQRYKQPRYPFTVRVRRFESSIAFDRQELVYRQSPYEISYDWYRLWAAKPRQMLEALVRAHLRDTNLFRAVVERLTSSLPKYELGCEVLALEELDASKDAWFAHLSLRCVLVDFDSGAQVWSHHFDTKQRVYQRTPQFVVRALSQILEREMGIFVDALDGFLAAETGLPATERVVHRPPTAATPGGAEAAPATPPDATDGQPPEEPSATLKPRAK